MSAPDALRDLGELEDALAERIPARVGAGRRDEPSGVGEQRVAERVRFGAKLGGQEAEARTVGQALVVNLPGSRGGVKDGLAVVVPLLRHAVEQIVGSDH